MNGESGPKAAPVIAAAKQDQHQSTPREVTRLVHAATIEELAEVWRTVLHDGFQCPRCSRRYRTARDKLHEPVMATVTSETTWHCWGRVIVPDNWFRPTYRIGCNGGTLWQLRRFTLEDQTVLRRFLSSREVLL